MTSTIIATTTIKYFSSYHFEQILNNIKFDPTFLPIVATSFSLFILFYKLINPILSNILIKDYRNFNKTQQIEWSTK